MPPKVGKETAGGECGLVWPGPNVQDYIEVQNQISATVSPSQPGETRAPQVVEAHDSFNHVYVTGDTEERRRSRSPPGVPHDGITFREAWRTVLVTQRLLCSELEVEKQIALADYYKACRNQVNHDIIVARKKEQLEFLKKQGFDIFCDKRRKEQAADKAAERHQTVCDMITEIQGKRPPELDHNGQLRSWLNGQLRMPRSQ